MREVQPTELVNHITLPAGDVERERGGVLSRLLGHPALLVLGKRGKEQSDHRTGERGNAGQERQERPLVPAELANF
jgi:hypothetical protein